MHDVGYTFYLKVAAEQTEIAVNFHSNKLYDTTDSTVRIESEM